MRLLSGNFGSGKTSFILQEILQLQDSYWIIVPSRRHKDQLYFEMLSQHNGIAGNPVITLSELHQMLLDHIFPNSKPKTLSNFEQFLIISHIIQKNNSNFRVFKKLNKRPEIIKMIYTLVRNLRTKNISHLETVPELADKIHDLQLILKEFEQHLLQNNLCDTWQEITLIKQHKITTNLLPNHIFIDGFVDFTANQFSLISFLAEQAEQLEKNTTITLTDAPHTVCQTSIRQFTNKFPHAEKISMPDLNHSISDGFLNNKDNRSDIDIFEIQAFGKHKEIEEVVNQIKKLYLYEQYNLTDIMVICKQQDTYAPILSSVLHKANIPFVLGKDTPLSQNPLILFIKKILTLSTDDFTHEHIEFLAHSNYVNPIFRRILATASEIFPIAIKGKVDIWRQSLNDFTPEETHNENFQKLKSLLNNITQHIYSIDINRNHSIDIFIDHLTNLLKFLGVQESLSVTITSNEHKKKMEHTLAEDYAGLVKLKSVLQQLKQSLNDTNVQKLTFGTFMFYIHTITDETRYRSEIPRRNALHILSPEDARGSFAKAVFILGMNEGEFPPPPKYDLFDRQDRESLNKISDKILGLSLWETDIDYLSKERLSFAVALSRAQKKLFLSRTPANEKGLYFGASHFLRKILEKNSFHRIPDNNSKKPLWDNPAIFEYQYPPEHYFEKSLIPSVPKTNSSEIQSAITYIKLLKEANECFRLETSVPEVALPYFGMLPKEHPIPQNYHQNKIFSSPTGLERLGRCRYQGLWQGIWKLKSYKLPEYTPEAADYGNLYHYVLEHYISQTKDYPDTEFYNPDLLHQMITVFINNSTQKKVFSLDFNYVFMVLSLFLQNMEIQLRENQEALYFELDSGDQVLINSLIPISTEHSLNIRCRIDRINQNFFDQGYHIIDYKKSGTAYESYQKTPFNLFQGFLYAALLKVNGKSPINSISYILLEKQEQFIEYPKKKNTFNSIEEYSSFKTTEILQLISLLKDGNFSPFTLSKDIGKELDFLFREKISPNYKNEYSNKCSYCELHTICPRKNKQSTIY